MVGGSAGGSKVPTASVEFQRCLAHLSSHLPFLLLTHTLHTRFLFVAFLLFSVEPLLSEVTQTFSSFLTEIPGAQNRNVLLGIKF